MPVENLPGERIESLVDELEGIIEEDVDKCIRNLTAIGRDGMNETDRVVLGIMTHKC